MKNKKRRTLSEMTSRIFITTSILWLICMYAVTSVAAEGFFVTFIHMGEELIERAWLGARLNTKLDGERDARPGYTEYVLWEAIQPSGVDTGYDKIDASSHRPLLKSETISYDSATAIFDAEGNIVAYPSNYFIFGYYFAEDFAAGNTYYNNDLTVSDPNRGYAVCVLDKQFEPEMSRFVLSQSFGSVRYDSLYYRFTGVLEGGYFTVYKIEYYLNPLKTGENAGWTEAPSYGLEIPDGKETVTLYTDYVQTNTYTPSRSFRYQGTKMNNLADFLEQAGPDFEHGRQYSFTDFISANARFYSDWSKYPTGNWDGIGELPETEYKVVTALLASPWRSALLSLRNVYLITFLLLLTGILWLRKTLQREVAAPLSEVNRAISGGFTNINILDGERPKFAESAELLKHYSDIKTRLTRGKDTVARLERAVRFAEDAEQNRRQMVANITHELKTPLAVIHSYAEGLRERIAEDKREQYLDVILSETERMDGMVLEMLDLSRLEAGKVKLLREDFSLSQMAKSVFERLEHAVEAKGLKLVFEADDECIINADAERIEQVITNFAVNAIHYTPPGGRIRLGTTKRRGETVFTIENDSEALSAEALTKVWGSFYRAEESRTSDGTGLGLAIAKSIIDLHGGRCSVRNTETGVEFTFAIKP